ncbi:U-box domain-containing protein [Drosera capensis]
MEVSLLKTLLNNITYILSSSEDFNHEPLRKIYQKLEEILKLLKPILGVVVSTELSTNDLLNKALEQLGESIDELRDLFGNWHPLLSRIYLVLQAESLTTRIKNCTVEIFQVLKDLHHQLPDELSSSSLEHCTQKIKSTVSEPTSAVITEALEDQSGGRVPSPERLTKVADCLGLRSSEEVLIEAVALEKLKENAEQAEKNSEVEYFEKLIALVTQMHDRLVLIKQSQSYLPVPIPADFCCPLSLELMTDPVIVASGQTYERAYIKKWLDLGLIVCPKTRQTLSHTNLIPNYTVKALIANWCEINNVKLPDPVKSLSLNQPQVFLPFTDLASLRDTQLSTNFRSNPNASPESRQPILMNRRSSSLSPRARQEPCRPNSRVEGNHSNSGGDDAMDMVKASPGDRLSYRETGSDSHRLHSVSPVTEGPVGAASPREHSPQRHNRTSSDSSIVSETNVAQGNLGDANQASESPAAYSSDASGELPKEPPVVTPITIPQREPGFPSRLMEIRSRSQSLWRRPSDRLTPRRVSSPAAETRPDLSGVEAQVKNLVKDLKSTSVETLRVATGEARQLAKHSTENRIVIADGGAISLLTGLLHSTDPTTQENAVTALLNLSINDNNKTAIADAGAIEPLIHVLQTGSPVAKENSAATLFSLSVMEENKMRIGRSGAIEPLVELLGNGTPRGKKDAATALFNLSIHPENKARIVQAGGIRHLVELMDPAAGLVDKAVAVLANLATIPEGKTAIAQAGGIPILVEVVELGSARGKENAAAALLQLCSSSRYCNMVLQEGAVPPLVTLSQLGTPRAREKAQALLSYFKNQRHNTGR